MRQRHLEMTPPLSLALRRTSNLQNLNSLRKDELTIDTLLGHEANHTVTCEELSELLEGTGTTVTDVVVAVVTEGHHVCRAKRRSIDIVPMSLSGSPAMREGYHMKAPLLSLKVRIVAIAASFMIKDAFFL